MEAAIAHLLALTNTYGYGFIFVISILEGPIISVLSGFLVSTGSFNWWIATAVLILGDLVGDTLYYCLGRFGGHWVITYWGAYIGITDARVALAKQALHMNHMKLILFSKTQAVGSAILFTAGALRAPYVAFMWYNILGTIPKTILFIVVGYYLGEAIVNANTYITYAALVFTGAAALIVLYVGMTWYVRSQNANLSE